MLIVDKQNGAKCKGAPGAAAGKPILLVPSVGKAKAPGLVRALCLLVEFNGLRTPLSNRCNVPARYRANTGKDHNQSACCRCR